MNKKVMMLIAGAGLISALFAVTEGEPEENKLGGGGSVGIGVMWLNLDPLKEVVEDDLNRTGFEFDNNRFMTLSATGYFGNRKNGFKIGYSGMIGYNTMYSDPWKSISKDSSYIATHPDSIVDSVVQLHNLIVTGGLLVERSFSCFKNCNLYAGGMLGGGVLVSIADQHLAKEAFSQIENTNNDNNDKDNNQRDSLKDDRVAAAPLWAFDLHGGMIYSLTSWMHVGLDASATMYYSSIGFSYRQGSFMSVNPGFKVRLIFGSSV